MQYLSQGVDIWLFVFGCKLRQNKMLVISEWMQSSQKNLKDSLLNLYKFVIKYCISFATFLDKSLAALCEVGFGVDFKWNSKSVVQKVVNRREKENVCFYTQARNLKLAKRNHENRGD